MSQQALPQRLYLWNGSKQILLVIVATVLVLPLIAHLNYLLFHTLVALFSIVIAASIFIITWNTRRFHENSYLTALGMIFLLVACMDLLHTMAYRGMVVFPFASADLSVQLWITAHYLQSGAFFVSALLIGKRIPLTTWRQAMPISLVGLALLIGCIMLGWFPACSTASGPTLFREISELIIILLLLVSLLFHWRKRLRFDRLAFTLQLGAIALLVLSDIAFACQITDHSIWNLVGHLLKFSAFMLIYKTIIESGLNEPYSLLFSQRKRIEDALRRERDFFSNVIDAAGGLLVVFDTRGRIIRFNDACEELTGYTLDEVRRKPIWEVLYPSEEIDSVKLMVENLKDGIFPSYHESSWVKKSGERRWIAWSSTVLQGHDGAIEFVIGSGMDITAQKVIEENLQRLTLLDPLTGMYNRRGFMMFAAQQIKLAERMRKRVLIVFCDIDYMKVINDRYGHLAGDEALTATAAVLKETFRESDIIGRFGGDEFVVLAVEKSTMNADEVLQRLQLNLKASNLSSTRAYTLSLSIGIAYFDPESAQSLDQLLDHADIAMYRDKQRKRSEVAAPAHD